MIEALQISFADARVIFQAKGTHSMHTFICACLCVYACMFLCVGEGVGVYVWVGGGG